MQSASKEVESVRELLIGRRLSDVRSMDDSVDLHFDRAIVRALSDPFGTWMAHHRGWRYPEGDSVSAMRRFIGRVVDGFGVAEGEYAQLSFYEDAFTIPLREEDRRGPYAVQVVAVDRRFGRIVPTQMWTW